MDLTKLQAAMTQFIADQTKFNADFKAFLTGLTPPPDQQPAIDALTTQLTAGLQAMDALINPPAPTLAPSPAPAPEPTPAPPTA